MGTQSFLYDGIGLGSGKNTPLMYILILLSLGSLTMIDIRFRSEVKGKALISSNFFSLPRMLITVSLCPDLRNS